jgi:hypothetical protein
MNSLRKDGTVSRSRQVLASRATRRLRRSALVTVAAVPLALGTALVGSISPAVASAAARPATHQAAARTGATPTKAAFTPPLPRGTVYAPKGSHQPAKPSPTSRPGIGARLGGTPRVTAAEQRRLATTSRSLQKASVPATETEITSVSCWSSKGCMAVGYTYDYGTWNSYAAEWNGKSWSTSKVPQYVDDGYTDYQELYGVSCWTATRCMAVGYSDDLGEDFDDAYVEFWTGGKWSVDPVSTSVFEPDLEGVSCRQSGGTDLCAAVGNSDGGDEPFAMTWDGVTFTEDSTPSFSGDENELYGVSCPSITYCVAAGELDGDAALLLSWSGSSWTQVSADNPGQEDGLTAISCGSATSCTAVGWQYYYDQELGLIEQIRISGGTASVSSDTSGKNPDISFTELTGISCTSAIFCMAVGYGSSTGYSTDDAFAESFNAGTWRAVKTSSPGSTPYDSLYAVACTAATSCTAGGVEWSASTHFADQPLAESLSKGTFGTSSVPNVYTPEGYVNSVSCPTSKFCVADGYFDTGGTDVALMYLWNGKSWTLEATPNPSGYASWLDGVTCTSASFCALVGTSATFDYDNVMPLFITFNGSSFSAQKVSQSTLELYEPELYSVSCVSTKACVAVGESDEAPFSVSWNGKSLSFSTMPQPGDDYAYPASVSCISASKCYTVVEYEYGDATETYLASWNGSRWSFITQLVFVNDAEDVELNGIACTSSSRCVAVGEYYLSGSWDAASDILGKSGWAIHAVPSPSGTEYADLNAVVCRSSTSCTAAGVSYSSSVDRYVPMIAKLSGTTWSKTSPAGSAAGEFYGVACPTSSLCIAGGSSYPNLDNDKALLDQDKSGKWSVVS